MSTVVLPVRQRTPEWLEERRRHLGSSDAPVLAGERGSLLGLWAEKRGLVDPEFDDDTEDLMEIGAALEPALRALYVTRTGRPIRQRNVLHVSREWPVAAASLDAESGRRIVELKWSHSADWSRALADDSPDPVPPKVMAQVQWQLYVTGREVADVAVLVGREFHVPEVGRDDRYIGDLLYMARYVWGYVESGERPPVDGSDETTRVLARLHPRDSGAWLAPDPELRDLVGQLREAKAATKEAEDREATVANAIRALLGDASGITGLASWKKNADSQHVDWRALAGTYRAVLEEFLEPDRLDPPITEVAELDELAARHTTTKEGPRVLRLLGGSRS